MNAIAIGGLVFVVVFGGTLTHSSRCEPQAACVRWQGTQQTIALWGNFPQTYSMAGLILSAMRLSRSWEDRYWRG